MTDQQPSDRPRQAAGAQLEHSSGRTIIASSDREVVVAVNDSAAALFELCDGVTTIGEMVTAVCEASSIPLERARQDVVRTLDELGRAGLVIFDRGA